MNSHFLEGFMDEVIKTAFETGTKPAPTAPIGGTVSPQKPGGQKPMPMGTKYGGGLGNLGGKKAPNFTSNTKGGKIGNPTENPERFGTGCGPKYGCGAGKHGTGCGMGKKAAAAETLRKEAISRKLIMEVGERFGGNLKRIGSTGPVAKRYADREVAHIIGKSNDRMARVRERGGRRALVQAQKEDTLREAIKRGAGLPSANS